MRLSGALFQAARAADTVEAIDSGNLDRIGRRSRNLMVGRILAHTGAWRALWGR